jgi:glycosyltransferase involved in cell wall biosynthesis
MTTPKISVIIPTYNRANFIRNTIISVINQTYTDWELLVIDDGSTDNTHEIVDEFINKDSRIKYFYQENSGGPSSPKNLGIEKAEGVYVAFLDSDDEWFPTKLEEQLAVFENSNNPKLGVVACYLNIKDYKTGKILSTNNEYYRGNVLDKLVSGSLNLFTASSIMTKLSILKIIGPFDTNFKISEDMDMWLRISEKGYEFDYVPLYLLNYLVHDGNIYYQNKDNDWFNYFIMLIKKHYQLFLYYDFSILGNFYFTKKKYKLARKYLIRNLFGNNYSFRQKIRIIGQLIITYYPPSEKIWQNIKKYFKNNHEQS